MSDDLWLRVEELFHAALGLPPEQRAAFVEEQSGRDSELRHEVESLLTQHNSTDSVFDQPAWPSPNTGATTASRTGPVLASGAHLGPYQITGLLGAGGMGQVYRAHDSRLQRSVAIKVMAPGQDARRFEREARAVAALSHPNVVPIFDVGHDSGVDYLVEELVEGESLRELLRRGPLDVARCRHLAVQIAEGLAAAHRAGIVHRDLKPGNVMVSSGDFARILDFGLATSHRARPDDATMSMPHLDGVVGTAAYMSPEQIQGGKIDTRSDIFSYGAVLYEMITGRQAFARDTVPATLAAVLQNDPSADANTPPRLARIIDRCLHKDAGSRFQTIEEVGLALDDLDWNTGQARRVALRAGAAALVIGVAVAGWLFFSRKAPVLTNKDTVVLADFSNSTGDSVFDDALKQGLAVQLAQSPLLNILSEQRVRSALREMTRSPDQAVSAKVAQEVCERTGSKAYIAGSIDNLGGHYVIGLNAVNCATGDTLAREQTEAKDKQQVLAALGRVAERLRNKLGESLSSIQKFDVPLAQATTPSLEALKAYSFGLSQWAKGDHADAVPLFQKAIELDPDFAIAYANLGTAYHLLMMKGDRTEEALRKAFALRNRASEREKFNISALYYEFVTIQTDEAIQTCELWAKTYPLDFAPHRILGFEYKILGRLEQGAEEIRKAIELDPSQALPNAGLMFAYMGLNRLPEARTVYQDAQAHKLASGDLDRARYLLAFLEGDRGTMTKLAAALARQRGYDIEGLLEESKTEAYFGHLRRAQELSRRAEDAYLGDGAKAGAADVEAMEAMREGLFGNSARARDRAAAAWKLGLPPPEPFPDAPNTAVQPRVALALAGDPVLAAKVADRLASNIPPGGFAGRVWLPEIRAAIEIKRGNPMRAVELLAPVEPFEAGLADRLLAAYLRGEAYLAAHRGREAAAEFQKIVNHPGVVLSSPIGALARVGTARSYSLEGDATKAGAAYEDFLKLWKDADSDIPILIAAKAEYARLKGQSASNRP